MRLFSVSLVIVGVGILSPVIAVAQTADIEGHVFNKRSGSPIEGAVVVISENVSVGPLPFLLAEDVADANGFYGVRIPTPTFAIGVIEVFCRTPNGIVIRGASSAPLEQDVIRRRDIYLKAPRRLDRCLDPEPGDIPPYLRD